MRETRYRTPPRAASAVVAPRGADHREPERLVQRRQRLQRFEFGNDRIVDDDRRNELHATVNDAVPDRRNLVGIHPPLEVPHRGAHRIGAASGREVHLATRQTFSGRGSVDRSVHGVLQRRGTGVQYEDAVAGHCSNPLWRAQDRSGNM